MTDVLFEVGNEWLEEQWGTELSSVGMPRESVLRAYLCYSIILFAGSSLTYWFAATVNYLLVYVLCPSRFLTKDERTLKPGQLRREILWSAYTLCILPWITAPIYLLHWAGYGKVYRTMSASDWQYTLFSIGLFVLFTDCCIYWLHRILHREPFYKWIHEQHHTSINTTPFAAMSFRPIDGWIVALPYHVFTFMVPFNTYLYLAVFPLIQLWTVYIHDRVPLGVMDGVVAGARFHGFHHTHFKVNFGQYTSLFDRVFGTYKPVQDYDRRNLRGTGIKAKGA